MNKRRSKSQSHRWPGPPLYKGPGRTKISWDPRSTDGISNQVRVGVVIGLIVVVGIWLLGDAVSGRSGPALILGVPLGALGGYIAARLLIAVRPPPQLRFGACPKCGYEVKGHAFEVCPECGIDVKAARRKVRKEMRRFGPRRRRVRKAR